MRRIVKLRSGLLGVAACGSTSTRSMSTGFIPRRPNKRVEVLNNTFMAYVDTGGDQDDLNVVFLHGNPSNSFLWRDPIRVVHQATGLRCVAPDLIGQGLSGDAANHSYRFMDHYRHLKEWFIKMELPDRNVVLVIHDWGSALGFTLAREFPSKIKGLVHMESIPAPLEGWEEFPAIATKVFQNLRTKGVGESMVMEKNFFVNRLLLGERSDWTPEELDAYSARFQIPEKRAPTLQWPREIPIKGDGPQDVIEIVEKNAAFHKQNKLWKYLFIDAEPGFFSRSIKEKTKDWVNQQVVGPVPGLHFIQETAGIEIGNHIVKFLNESCPKQN